MAPGGSASGIGQGGITVLSSCQDSCLREGHVLTFVAWSLVLRSNYSTHPSLWALWHPATSLVPTSTPCSSGATRVVCRESAQFRQVRTPFPLACGRLAKSARRCTPRHSRRLAKRTIEQSYVTVLGTIAFCLHTMQRAALFLPFFPCALGCFRDCLLDVSRLLGLTLRPSAPVFRCHRDISATLEAGTCAGSRALYFSFVFLLVSLHGEVRNRFLTACVAFLFKGC